MAAEPGAMEVDATTTIATQQFQRESTTSSSTSIHSQVNHSPQCMSESFLLLVVSQLLDSSHASNRSDPRDVSAIAGKSARKKTGKRCMVVYWTCECISRGSGADISGRYVTFSILKHLLLKPLSVVVRTGPDKILTTFGEVSKTHVRE